MKSIVEISHDFLLPVLHAQAVCIDATLGQGKDTRFFIDHCIKHVYAFEIQESLYQQALEAFAPSVFTPFLAGHETMKEHLAGVCSSVDAILFNFGWDPSQPGSLTTKTSTSLQAVQQALDLLRIKGRMALVFYPHPEGCQEKQAILAYLKTCSGLEILLAEKPFQKSPSACLVEKKANWKGSL